MKNLLFVAPLSACLVFGQATPSPAPAPAGQAQPAQIQPGTLPVSTVAPNTVVLKIGSESMTRAEFEQLIEALPERVRGEARGTGRRKLAEQLVDLKVASQEAKRRKLEQSPAVKQQLALQTDSLLANALFTEVMGNVKPDDAAMKAYYEQHKSEYQQVKARHILIRFQGSRVPLKPNQKDLTEAEALAKAQEVRKKLASPGTDFAVVAKAESDDTGSGANGGDLGTFGKGQMVQQFEDAVFSAEVGKISDPVKTPFGYHIIQVQEQVNKKYDDVKGEIEQRIKPELAKKQMDDLKKGATVTIDEGYFGK